MSTFLGAGRPTSRRRFWVLGDLQAEPFLGAGRPTSQYRFKSVARQTSITFVPRLWVLGDLQANIVSEGWASDTANDYYSGKCSSVIASDAQCGYIKILITICPLIY